MPDGVTIPPAYLAGLHPGEKLRIRSLAEKHWLGHGATGEQQAAIEEVRRQYLVTAQEYYKAAHSLYDTLSVQMERASAHKVPFKFANRNVQLFLAYSILWEAFNHIYEAASYTAFAAHGPEHAPLEEERAKIARALSTPILTDQDFARITVLKNGESANSAISRMVNRSSRELKELYGRSYDQTLTNMDAFLQGLVEAAPAEHAGAPPIHARETWTVQALDDAGRPIDPLSPFSPEKYRSVITWHCYQIRNNLNFVGKSDGSIDDAILIIRAYCLVDPVVKLLLNPSRCTLIFALDPPAD